MQHREHLLRGEEPVGDHSDEKRGGDRADGGGSGNKPDCSPVKCNPWPSQVPTVTYQAPQMKYSRNNIRASRPFICKVIMPLRFA